MSFIASPTSSDLFVEKPSSILDNFVYPQEGNDPGLVVIFNQETFKNYKTRKGTRKDVQELITTFGRLNFNIEAKYIFNDLGEKELKETINKICEEDHTKRNCLICIFLSHGAENDKLAVRDGLIEVENVYQKFTECRTLEDKPKLFIFQACKKSSNESEDKIDSLSKEKKLVSQKSLNLTIPKDVILSYSTVEDKASARHTKSGTWFIQEFCRNLTAYGRRDEVCSLIMRTTKCVANNYCKNFNQIPIFITTLTKQFYLTKSKDRMELLRLKKEIKLIHEQVAEIKQKHDELNFTI